MVKEVVEPMLPEVPDGWRARAWRLPRDGEHWLGWPLWSPGSYLCSFGCQPKPVNPVWIVERIPVLPKVGQVWKWNTGTIFLISEVNDQTCGTYHPHSGHSGLFDIQEIWKEATLLAGSLQEWKARD